MKAYRYSQFVCFLQAEDGIRYLTVTGVQTCALPISMNSNPRARKPRANSTRPSLSDTLTRARRGETIPITGWEWGKAPKASDESHARGAEFPLTTRARPLRGTRLPPSRALRFPPFDSPI